MSKETIDQKYLDQANQLEVAFFEIVNKDKPTRHRVLKVGKSIGEFNQLHSQIWRNHEAELIAQGFLEPPVEPPPTRNLQAEIDDLKARIGKLEQ